MTSPEVTLRAVTDADLETLYAFQRDPVALRMAEVQARGRDDFFRHWRERVLADPDVVARAIEVSGRLAGSISSFRLAPSGPLLVGYMLGAAFWGRGVATLALTVFLAAHERRRPLFAGVSLGNPASRRVLEKCGFLALGAPATADDGVIEQRLRLDL